MKIPTSCPQTQRTLSLRSPTAQKAMPIRTVWTVLFILPNKVLFWKEFTSGFLSHRSITFNVVLEPLCLICRENHCTEDGFELGSRTHVCISLPWTSLQPELLHLKQNALGEVMWLSPRVSIATCKGVLQHLNAMVKWAGDFNSEGTLPICKHTENNCIVCWGFFLNLVSMFCLYSSPFCLPPCSSELSLLMLFSMRIKNPFLPFK